MLSFVLRRLAIAILQLLIVTVVTFVLLRLLPIDPTVRLVGFNATPAAEQTARVQLGINGSIPHQLVHFADRLFLHADLGSSWDTGVKIPTELWQHFTITLQVIVLGFLLAVTVAIVVGRAAAARPGGRLDKAILGYGLFAGAQPDFWWGLLFIYVIFFVVRLAPAPLGVLSLEYTPPTTHTGFILIDSLIDGSFGTFLNALWHFWLPAFTVAFVMSGPLIKMTRQSLLTTADAEYILYARAAGLPRRTVRWYMLRNALLPIITVTAALFAFMIGGSVLIETVFSLNGIGVYALNSTLNANFPAVQGAVMIMTAFALLVYLIMDVLYALLDPRVRYGAAR